MIPKEPTDVEKQVLTAFQADGISVVDADGAEISGDFLRGLFLGKYDKNADYRGTCIANAVVSDALNMEFCETKFPVRFHNCSFVREIKLQKLVCPELDFRSCTLEGEFDARMVKVDGSMNMKKVSATATVSLANADIGGQLVCTGGSFQNKEGYAFYAPDIKVAVDVFLNDGFVTVGEVNLSGADIGRQLVCTGGNFCNGGGNAINAQSIKAGSILLNSDSSDKQFKAEGTVWLVGADIMGQLDCRGGNFHNKGRIALNAERIKAAGGVTLSNGFNADGAVSLAGAEIGGQFACVGGSFRDEESGNALIAQNIKVVGNVLLHDGFKSDGTVNLLGADIDGQLICTGGSFQHAKGNALIAHGIKVTGNVFFNADDSNGENIKKFEAVGAVSLAYADIKGQLACNGGSFCNKGKGALNAQGIKVTREVLLRDGFKAEGEVNFLGADVGGQFVCADGTFSNEGGNAFVAQGVKMGAGVLLGDGFNAKGAVTLAGAEIRGQLNCSGGNFQNQDGPALNAQGVKVASEVFLIPHDGAQKEEKFSANGLVSFTNATIGGSFLLKGCKLAHLLLSGTNVMGEFQDDADAYKLDKDDHIDLNIDGFRYHRLDATKERVKDRLEWVGLMSEGDDFYPQPYEQLMKVYREMGHMNWARRVGFELEKKRHKWLRLNRDHKRFVVLGWAWWIWYWVLRGTIGYGYKPFRAITRWFAPLIVAGLVLFSGTLPCPDPCRAGSDSCHCMAPSDAEVLLSADWKVHGKLPKDYPGFNPVYYAVEAALPVLPLGQTENWHPKTPWIRRAQGLITIIGALVLTILASYGVGVLGPRWKNE